jgi:ribosome maturation factor RimP
MTATSPVDGVRALAEPAAAAAGLVLESVTVTPAGRRRVLRVVVDLPDGAVGGVPMEAVASASQALSAALDESSVMGSVPYVLEVSSPGADRPLTEPRHWRRARGRLVQATLVDGSRITGRLVDTDGDGVRIDATDVPWDRLRRGRVELEFAHQDDATDDELGSDELDDTTDDDTTDDDTDGEEA